MVTGVLREGFHCSYGYRCPKRGVSTVVMVTGVLREGFHCSYGYRCPKRGVPL